MLYQLKEEEITSFREQITELNTRQVAISDIVLFRLLAVTHAPVDDIDIRRAVQHRNPDLQLADEIEFDDALGRVLEVIDAIEDLLEKRIKKYQKEITISVKYDSPRGESHDVFFDIKIVKIAKTRKELEDFDRELEAKDGNKLSEILSDAVADIRGYTKEENETAEELLKLLKDMSDVTFGKEDIKQVKTTEKDKEEVRIINLRHKGKKG
mgnify:CR=1 FL=1